MIAVKGYPPLIDEIDAVFHVKGRPVFYAWGDTIFVACGAVLTQEKFAHEMVHGVQQGQDVVGWWRRYMADPAFRLEQEIQAHVAEYDSLCQSSSGRAARRRNLAVVAGNLSSRLYGGMISREAARRVIQDAAAALPPPGM